MKLNAPKVIVWWICLVLLALAVISTFVAIPLVGGNAFWFAVVGGGLLLVATAMKGV